MTQAQGVYMVQEKTTEGSEHKKTRQRSPNYPAVDLKDAVERAEKLWKADGKVGAPVKAAVQHIGFSSDHGLAMSVLSALKKFGLIEDKNGRIIPTKQAIDILSFPEGHERHSRALKNAAIQPVIYRKLLKRYMSVGNIPSDASLEPELIADEGFNPKSVSSFIKDFRATLEFAGILEENKLKLSSVGDLDENSDSSNGAEASIDLEIADAQKPPSQPTRPQIERKPMAAGSRQDVFNLTEGEAVLQWPAELSEDSYEDFKAWLELVLKKVKRSVKSSDASRG
ncbi:MAG TPA: hypothetical protein VGL91_09020 [Acidobacteriota bacterium]|jgi:hypothetical protein